MKKIEDYMKYRTASNIKTLENTIWRIEELIREFKGNLAELKRECKEYGFIKRTNINQ